MSKENIPSSQGITNTSITDFLPDNQALDALQDDGRKITFGVPSKHNASPENTYKFPFVEGERFGAALINDPWKTGREMLPVAKRFVDLISTGGITAEDISIDDSDNPYIIEDDLVAQQVGTILKARIAHTTFDGEPGEFDGYFVTTELSAQAPMSLLDPSRVQLKSEIVQAPSEQYIS